MHWWYYLGFPIFGMFLVAQLLMLSPGYLHRRLMKETFLWMYYTVRKFSVQLIAWWFWWTRVFMLQAMFCTGALILPVYYACVIYLDADYKPLQSKCNRSLQRKRNQKGFGVLTLAGRLCVFSDVSNFYGKELVML